MDTTTAAHGGAQTGSAPRRAPRAAVVAVVVALGALFVLPGTALASAVSISPQAPAGVRVGDSVTFTANVALDDSSSMAVTGYTWSLDGKDQPGGDTFDTGGLSAGTHTVSVAVAYSLSPGVPATDPLTDATTVTAAANRNPTVRITTAPSEAQLGLPPYTLVATASDPENDPLTYTWSDTKLAQFGTAEATTTWQPTVRGTHTVTVTVDDGHGGSASSFVNISVPDQQPIASFDVTGSGLTRTLSSTSTDLDGDQLSYTWSVSTGVTLADAHAAQTTATFPGPGSYNVVLTVKETNGTLSDKSDPQTVVIGDVSPTVSLTVSPNPVAPNQPVTITAAASDPDPDGANLTYAWDVNGTKYTTPTIPQQIFTTPGAYKVKVTVRDPQGASASDADTIIVSEAAPPSPPPTTPQPAVVVTAPPVQTPATSPTAPKLIDPFPIVRIRGRIFPRYTKFDVFSIRAPKGATVRVRCKGPSCPRKWSIAAVKRRTHWVRFRPLERNMPAGTVLEIFVEKQGLIGKYTRFIVRAGQAPSRRDRCVKGSRSRVVRCPAG